ncbi:hypothetical protein [Actinoallomurus rhizosphaericola]|uniref:hypothetical protein n=1 Tax=Actinoallomurus rhizosphaericola TaxID=2952536 RepID=UPI0020936282|nr:hypothetical protein [Actinoallomurus rhizosphaericola]MCO5995447.1 hypothetical protein [Actinoallomurus rhizosphaericola]
MTLFGDPVDTAEAGRLADRIRKAVTGCASVARLAEGPVATYLPGRAVQGVAVGEGEVRIAVVAVYDRPLAEVADQVRRAARSVVPEWRIDVAIDDIEIPGRHG